MEIPANQASDLKLKTKWMRTAGKPLTRLKQILIVLVILILYQN